MLRRQPLRCPLQFRQLPFTFLEAALRAGHASLGSECWGVLFSESASHLGPKSRQNVPVISGFSGVLKPAPCIYLLQHANLCDAPFL